MRLLSASAALCLLSLATAAAASPSGHHQRKHVSLSWPMRFFRGRTAGEGRLRVLGLFDRPIHVRGVGRVSDGGALTLRQSVVRDGQAPSTREWRLAQAGGRLVGTLTDTSGPVTGEVSGRRLHLSYTMKGALGVRVDQWLDLQPDGATVQNVLWASVVGVPVARLRETIRKQR